ncbi:MAG: hypothetical protein D3903_14285 [Candidatus Electrothrix sp. GM3_4]|nr:hypothetical protein [Candidatus Electrothrix sp. GM3_4]
MFGGDNDLNDYIEKDMQEMLSGINTFAKMYFGRFLTKESSWEQLKIRQLQNSISFNFTCFINWRRYWECLMICRFSVWWIIWGNQLREAENNIYPVAQNAFCLSICNKSYIERFNTVDSQYFG